MQDAGHGGGGDGIKIKSAGRILDTTAAFGRLRGCRKYAAVKPESINHLIKAFLQLNSQVGFCHVTLMYLINDKLN